MRRVKLAGLALTLVLGAAVLNLAIDELDLLGPDPDVDMDLDDLIGAVGFPLIVFTPALAVQHHAREEDEDQGEIVTYRCGIDPTCDWTITDVRTIAERERRVHERRRLRHAFSRMGDVEASPAWRHPYREPKRERDT